MVVDTSALLAVLFNDKTGPWVLDHLQANSDDLAMSTVNYAEVLILVQDRQPETYKEIRETIMSVSDLKDAPKRLIEMANERGGDDNITVIVVKSVG